MVLSVGGILQQCKQALCCSSRSFYEVLVVHVTLKRLPNLFCKAVGKISEPQLFVLRKPFWSSVPHGGGLENVS